MSDKYDIISDISSERITVRVPSPLGTLLRDTSRLKGETPSDLVRAALEKYLAAEGHAGSAYKLAEAAGLIGSVRRAPKDLSTNPRHLEGFGKIKGGGFWWMPVHWLRSFPAKTNIMRIAWRR